MSTAAIAALIDHSVLRPTATLAELEAGCLLGRRVGAASVCVLPHFVPRAAALLQGSPTRTSTVIGFPHGGHTLWAKVREAELALEQGATELDAVVNVSLVSSGAWELVADEIHALTRTCHQGGARLKLIFETCYLSRDQKIRLCELSSAAGVDWVKTSTGFGSAGATPEDVRLLREHCPATVSVKASGGIGTLSALLEFHELGANRIGTSRTEEILRAAADGEAALLPSLPPSPAPGAHDR